jgi:hypothetical protein
MNGKIATTFFGHHKSAGPALPADLHRDTPRT